MVHFDWLIENDGVNNHYDWLIKKH